MVTLNFEQIIECNETYRLIAKKANVRYLKALDRFGIHEDARWDAIDYLDRRHIHKPKTPQDEVYNLVLNY